MSIIGRLILLFRETLRTNARNSLSIEACVYPMINRTYWPSQDSRICVMRAERIEQDVRFRGSFLYLGKPQTDFVAKFLLRGLTRFLIALITATVSEGGALKTGSSRNQTHFHSVQKILHHKSYRVSIAGRSWARFILRTHTKVLTDLSVLRSA